MDAVTMATNDAVTSTRPCFGHQRSCDGEWRRLCGNNYCTRSDDARLSADIDCLSSAFNASVIYSSSSCYEPWRWTRPTRRGQTHRIRVLHVVEEGRDRIYDIELILLFFSHQLTSCLIYADSISAIPT